MIYQIGIGEFDNCYIITGGLTGLASFEPTLIDASDYPAMINIDSSDDNIFTPFKKQSLEVSIIKTFNSQYSDIIAGDDNLTYGILIENGELELTGEDLKITSGGKLKFIGTLSLESYSEQYKEISIVKFTFNDRIGTLDKSKFYNELPYLPITRIFAELLNNVICSSTLKLEWPYAISESDDPSHFFIDIKEFFGNTKTDMLKELLKDFGLQLYVDYEDNSQTKLADCGCIKIISINNIPDQNITYWNLVLYKGTRIYNYSGSKGAEEFKKRHLIGSNIYPLLRNEASLSLERMAKNIVAKTETVQIPILWGGSIDERFNDEDIATNFKYVPFAQIEDQEETVNIIKDVLFYRNLYGLKHIELTKPFSEIGIPIGSTVTNISWDVIISQPIIRIKKTLEPTPLKFRVDYTAAVLDYYDTPDDGGFLKICIIMYDGTDYKIWKNDNTWVDFTSYSQINTGDTWLGTVLYVNGSYVADGGNISVPFDNDVVFLLAMSYGEFTGPLNTAHVSNISITNKTTTSIDFVSSETLTTELNANNRNDVELNVKLLNRPDVYGMDLEMGNLIMDAEYNRPLVITYKEEEQTILAHLSDQYGWQYKYNRWNVDGIVKSVNDSLNIMGQFGLEEKVLILLSGEYDVRRRELKGKWGQVLEIDELQYRLLSDYFTPFTWDDGNYIMLN